MLIMKFGGTSVADAQAIVRVINLIKTRRANKTIVIVSAISEATNILTHVTTLAKNNNLQQCKEILVQFKTRHLNITKNLIHNTQLLTKTQNQINSCFLELEDILTGISLISELSDRSFAKTVSYGELLSSAILHAAMLEHNIKNVLIDARDIIITDDNYLKGKPNLEEMTQVMPPLLNKWLDQGNIVLTQGFIASTIEGITTILGREGSDYSASLIGMVMDATEIQIWTDVDGIMTSDPRKIANTKFIPYLSFSEAAELSYFGAKVIHPLTIQPAAAKNIPVRILNSKNPDSRQEGSLITGNIIIDKQIKITAITYQENIKIINISSEHKLTNNGLLQKTFSLFDHHQITIYAATISEAKISLAINNDEKLNKIIDELTIFAKTSIEEDKSLVCIIGRNLNSVEQIVSNIFKILDGFNIRMMIHGSSNTNLILIVQKNDLITIVQKLHDGK